MLKRAWLMLLVLLATAGPLLAQATATLNGRVIDDAGAVLPGAIVTVTNVATGATRDTVTNGEGLYSVPALNPGNYDVKIALPGFATADRKNIELITGSTLTVDLKLSVASLEESVTVSGQAPLIEATQATVSNSIRQTEVLTLPMLNRTMGALMSLLPGARDVTGTISAHGASSNWVSFGGGGGQNYNMLVDGIDNKEDHCGGTEIVYSLEGIQEFKVMNTGSQAEYGKGTASVLMATKSGTNQFHGTTFLYGRNESLIKTDYFSDPANGGLGKAPFSRAQWGGSLGGPLVRDKAWFFGSLERVQQDFSIPRPQSVINELKLLVPLNIHVDPSSSVPQPFRDLLMQGKVNFNLNHQHSGYVRISGETGYVDNDAVGASAALLTFASPVDRNHQNLWNLAGGETWVINPTTVNQFTAQFISFTHDNIYPQCPLSSASLGINACLPEKLSFPSVSAGVGNAYPDWFNFERKWEFKDDLSKQIGRHALKFGIDYTYMPTFGGVFGAGSPGTITFFADPSTIVNNLNGKYPQGFQTPGAVSRITETSGVIGDYSSDGNWGVGVYAQDDFKISPNVTLNLGLRYDAYNFLNTQQNLATNRTFQVLKAIGNSYGDHTPSWDKNNIGPRVGIAWDVRGDGKDVVRGSYGIFYMQQIKNSTYQQEFLQKDFVFFTQALSNSAVGVGQLANFVYGVTPLPSIPAAPTTFPPGLSSTGYWYDPNIKDAQTQQTHAGWSHLFPHETVLSVDYTHVLLHNGWRPIDINPLINGVRPLAADFQRVYGDPRIMGPVIIYASLNRALYDEIATHFEHRFSAEASFQVNYTLAWSRGMGGVSDGTARVAAPYPQTPSATGGDIYAPWEWGPTAYDERHRVTMAGLFKLPFGIDLSPSITAATARPYTLYRAINPSGEGGARLQLLGPDGNPVGINQVRGLPLFDANARVTKNLMFGQTKLGIFAEFYNLTNRANFGNQYGGNQYAPTTYQQPVGFLGGIGAVSTIPNSFQVQFGGRFSF